MRSELIMDTIVFLFVTPALINDDKKFSLSKLVDRGYSIEIWDLTPTIEPNIERAVTQQRLGLETVRYQKFHNMESIRSKMSDYAKKAFFLPMFDLYYEVRKIYDLFTIYNINYGYVNNLCADVSISSSSKRSIRKVYIPKIFYHRVIRKIKYYKPALFVVHGSDISVESYRKKGVCKKNTKDIYSHTYDFERFQNVESYANNGKPYCVFLDQYFPFHPDNTIQRGLSFNPDKYYVEITDILETVKNHYGYEIIIAAHPRADYSDKQKYFRNYKIEYGKTAELVKGSSLIVGHFSNSLSFGVLAHKPMIIADIPTLKEVDYFSQLCNENANVYGVPIVTYGTDIEKTTMTYDATKYNKFILEYMTCDLEDSSSIWDRVITEINNINNIK